MFSTAVAQRSIGSIKADFDSAVMKKYGDAAADDVMDAVADAIGDMFGGEEEEESFDNSFF